MKSKLLFITAALSLLAAGSVDAQTPNPTTLRFGILKGGTTSQACLYVRSATICDPFATISNSSGQMTLAGAAIPTPTTGALGGVFAKACPSLNFVSGVGNDGNVTCAVPAGGGGGGTPGGSNGQIQVNNSGSFGGVTPGGDLSFNSGTGAFTIANGAVTAVKMASGAATGNLGYTPLNPASNLSDVPSPTTARTNLGLGSVAVLNTVAAANLASGAAAGNLGYTPLNPANNLSDIPSPSAARTNLGVLPASSPTFSGTMTGGSYSGDGSGLTNVVATDAFYDAPENHGGGTGASAASNVTAFAAAIATGKPVRCAGTYNINDQIVLQLGQNFGGTDRMKCILNVATFNSAADNIGGETVMRGVLRACPGSGPSQQQEAGATVHDVTIQFTQPDTTSMAALNFQNNPAIYATNCVRWRTRNVRIVGAYIGYQMLANAGGSVSENTEMMAYKYGWNIDGAQDITRIVNPHLKDFGPPTTNQTNLFYANTIGINTGRADGLYVEGGLFLGGQGLVMYKSGLGTTFAHLDKADFDTFGGVNMSAGTAMVNDSIFTPTGTTRAITLTGGNLTVGNSYIWPGGTYTTQPVLASQADSSVEVSLIINDSFFDMAAYDVVAVLDQKGETSLNHNRFKRASNTTYTQPTISVSNDPVARLTAIGNRQNDKGSGTGTFISVALDNYHRIAANVAPGWTNVFPSNPLSGTYRSNDAGGWTAYTPTVVGGATGFNVTASRWKLTDDHTYLVNIDYNVSNSAAGSNTPTFSLPNGSTASANFPCFALNLSAPGSGMFGYTVGTVIQAGFGTLANNHYAVFCSYEAS